MCYRVWKSWSMGAKILGGIYIYIVEEYLEKACVFK